MTDLTDFEAALRADLSATERSAPAPRDLASRLLDDVLHGQPPRRELPRWVWPAVAAAVVLAVVLATVTAIRGNPFADRGSQPAHPIPPGVRLTGVHFVDAQQGWALGAGRCTGGTCQAVLARTIDGGRTWTSIALPNGVTAPGDVVACTKPGCVSDAAFAPDGRTGYLYSILGSQIYVTSDGGHTWAGTTARYSTMQLVVSGPNAIRVASPRTSGDRLQVSPLGGSTWRDVTPWHFDVTGVRLATAGADVYAFVEGAEYAWLYHSSDGGATWTHVKSDYLQHTPRTYDLGPLALWTFAVAPDGAVVVARFVNGRTPTLRVSTDGGSTFGPEHDLAVPAGVRPSAMSASLAAASASQLVETATVNRSTTYFVTSDGGATWRTIAQGPTQGALPDIRWAFPAKDFGVRIADDGHGVLVTTDQGETTSTRPVR
jgi:photosystem II stability/assembly factor-like uncharacterized protein